MALNAPSIDQGCRVSSGDLNASSFETQPMAVLVSDQPRDRSRCLRGRPWRRKQERVLWLAVIDGEMAGGTR